MTCKTWIAFRLLNVRFVNIIFPLGQNAMQTKTELTCVGNITSVVFDNILFKELKTKWISTRKESSFCPKMDTIIDMIPYDQYFAFLSLLIMYPKTFYLPPVALENRDLDCMTNLKIYSRERKHFWIGSCLSVEVTKSAQWRTQLRSPL